MKSYTKKEEESFFRDMFQAENITCTKYTPFYMEFSAKGVTYSTFEKYLDNKTSELFGLFQVIDKSPVGFVNDNTLLESFRVLYNKCNISL